MGGCGGASATGVGQVHEHRGSRWEWDRVKGSLTKKAKMAAKKSAPVAPPDPPPEPPSAGGEGVRGNHARFAVDLGIWPLRKALVRAQAQLRELPLPLHERPDVVEGVVVTRLRAGPFLTKADARSAIQLIREETSLKVGGVLPYK